MKISVGSGAFLPENANGINPNVCCFAGHRNISAEKIQHIIQRLNEEVDKLINNGVTDFLSGGALGFDCIAASLIIAKKQQSANIRLIFALPYDGFNESWTNKQKQLLRSLLSEADEVRYTSEKYAVDCITKRNHYLADNSAYCICALTKKISETAQTVRYAKEQGLKIINVAK
ncbi:MAG: DUF1273 domain-containing protein [Firmicutes bacterium]|nr:DUF1273 domain-containing protein [Bacillota bacterium]